MNLDSFFRSRPLKGNAAQITWAERIRKKRGDDFKKVAIREMAVAIKPKITEKDCEKMGLKTMAQADHFVWFVAYEMFGAQDATWWIKTRDESVWTWLDEAIKRTVKSCSKTKFSK